MFKKNWLLPFMKIQSMMENLESETSYFHLPKNYLAKKKKKPKKTTIHQVLFLLIRKWVALRYEK